jgi:YVTN family beta-propeller protein
MKLFARSFQRKQTARGRVVLAGLQLALAALCVRAESAHAAGYQVWVSNERSDDITVIDGATDRAIATIPVGKRPRGIHASPDGKKIYVALSGTPISAPPQLDAKGNPIFKRGKDDEDEDEVKSDKSADAIGVIDVAQRKLIGRISGGSDPEEFSLSKDGRQLYVSNEDVKTASVIDIASGKVQHIIPVGLEPEGVATSPDGKRFYVTCEAGGEVYAIDAAKYTVIGHFKVNVRPRTVGFLPGSNVAFVPSESTGELNVIDTATLSISKVIKLPEGARPMSVKVSRDGKRIYVSTGRGATIDVLDAHSYDLVTAIKVGTRPWGMALTPDGKRAYVANGPSNDVSAVDLETNKEIARIKAGTSPWSVAIVPTGD